MIATRLDDPEDGMRTPASEELFIRQVRTQQIVVAALIGGAVFALGVVLILRLGGLANLPPAGQNRIVSYVIMGFAIVLLVVRLLVPDEIIKFQRDRIARGTWRFPGRSESSPPSRLETMLEEAGDFGKLGFVHGTRLILQIALLEAAAFALLVAYYLDGMPVVAVLTGLFILLMIAQFPTRARVEHWIENQLLLIEQDRQRGQGREMN
jgi:hypothetical protein